MDKERADQVMTEILFAREILRVGEECVEALEKLNNSLVLCLTDPLTWVPISQQHLIKALDSNQAIVDLCTGKGKMLEGEING